MLTVFLGACSKTPIETSGPKDAESYELVPDWPSLPDGYVLGEVAGVDVDSDGNVWIFHRADAQFSNETPITLPTVAEIDSGSGELLSTWGEGLFIVPHGLSIDERDHIWLTDVGNDLVFEFDREGNELRRLGTARR